MNQNRPLTLRSITLDEALHYSYVLRWMRNLWRRRLTSAGRACVWLMLFFGLNGAISLSLPMYIPWSFFFVFLVVTRLSSMRAVAPVRLTRMPISPVSAGREISYDIEVENKTNRTLHNLEVQEWYLPYHVTEPKGWETPTIETLAPGEKVRVRMRLLCSKRGAYTLPRMAVMSSYPFGVWRGVFRLRQETSFLVYPAFPQLETFDVPHTRQYQPGGILLSSQVGDSSEFMHTREYREGDNPRHIHWPSFARQNKPIVKVYQEEFFVRLALFLDSEWGNLRDDEPFETAVSVAASVADVLSRQDYIIDLFAVGEEVHHFQAGRALAHLENILEILACQYTVSSIVWDELSGTLLPQANQFSAMVLVLLNWDKKREALVQKLHVQGLATRVLLIRDSEPTLPLPQAADGSYRWIKPGEDWSALPAYRGASS
ncbi:MAG: DUF58 domain-containing protein [Deltaproteobacteria bacterium]|nr:MAG: DUF58 domain-containing protein [Deltaproteobacteria bacterium]